MWRDLNGRCSRETTSAPVWLRVTAEIPPKSLGKQPLHWWLSVNLQYLLVIFLAKMESMFWCLHSYLVHAETGSLYNCSKKYK